MHTQIRRNNMLTGILLLMFPVIILGMVWVFLALVNYFGSGVYDQYGNIVRHLDADVVNHYFVNTIPWVVIGPSRARRTRGYTTSSKTCALPATWTCPKSTSSTTRSSTPLPAE